MKKNILILLILAFFGCKSELKTVPTPVAKNGVIDLRDWNFAEDGAVKLNGEWKFFWEKLCEPNPVIGGDSCASPSMISFAKTWDSQGFPVDGFATYQLEILISSALNDELALAITDTSSNYEMYINGKLFSKNGKVGKTQAESKPLMKYYNFPISKELASTGKLEIIIHVSNFHEDTGGFWNPIKLGDRYDIEQTAKQKNILDLIVFGFLLMMGLYHIGLFTIRNKELSPLFLGIFCLLIALRVVSISERIILDVFPDFPFSLIRRIEFLSFYLGAYLFLRFVQSIFPEGFWKPAYYGMSIVFLCSTFLTLFFSPKVFLLPRTLAQIASLVEMVQLVYVLSLAIRKKLMGARLFLIGILIFSASIINEILKVQGLVQTPATGSYGLLIFTFFQAIVLSRRFAHGLDRSEKLADDLDKKSQSLEETTVELKQLTDNLEIKIQERTEELELANKEIDKLNKIMKKINSVSDLTDILTFIMFHLEKDYKFNEFWMLLKKEDSEELYTYAFVSPSTLPEKVITMKQAKISLDQKSLIQDFYQNKKVNQIFFEGSELSELDQSLISNHNFSYYLGLPIVVYDEVTGILFVHNKTVSTFSKEQFQKLQNFTNQIAGAISNSRLFKQAQLAKEDAETKTTIAVEAQLETEKQKRETEELNLLLKSLNEDMNIHVIMQKVYKYVNKSFKIQYYALYNFKSGDDYLELLEANFPDNISEEEKEKILNFKIYINDKKGVHSIPFHTKKLFYISKIRKSGGTEEEKYIKDAYNFASIIIIPLFLNNQIIGTLDFSSDINLNLSKEDQTKLSILGEQIAGIIYSSHLFKQIQAEKEIAHKAKQEIEYLNNFTKLINSFNNLDAIFKEAIHQLEEKFGFDFFWLQLLDNNNIYTRCVNHSEISAELQSFIHKFNEHLSPELGSIYRTYHKAKTIYFPSLTEKITSTLSPIDKTLLEGLNLNFMLQIPLIVAGEVKGVFHLNKSDKMNRLSKEDLKFIESFCEQLALAVNNSNLFEASEQERQKSEKLLLNILPADVASELKEKGFAEPTLFESVSVMFTDFKGFTQIAEKLPPQELIKDLDACFVQFDKISERYNLEKLKTIGDSYMCAGGIPRRNKTHAIDCVLAAFEIQSFMNMMKELKEMQGFPYWELRLGIHSGSLIAGVIGEKKFAYDVWGDTVNTASRMESSGTPGKINISGSTYQLVKDYFLCDYRGKVNAKNKGEVDMYYVNRLRPEFSSDPEGKVPNDLFWEKYG